MMSEGAQIATGFSNRDNSVGTPIVMTWQAFAERVTTGTVGEKDGPGFTPVDFEGNRRRIENATRRRMVVLDVEQVPERTHPTTGEVLREAGPVPPPPEEIVRRLKESGRAGFVYTSFSHTPDAPRYRVGVPLDMPFEYEGDERTVLMMIDRHVVLAVAKNLGLSDVIDTSKANAGAFFYYPRFPVERAEFFYAAVVEGRAVECVKLVKVAHKNAEQEIEDRNARAKAASERAADRARISRSRLNLETASGGIIAELRRELGTIESFLTSKGYKFFPGFGGGGGRYLHPKSTTGEPGISLMSGADGVVRYYSHHGCDPLCGDNGPVFGATAHDIVDLVIADEFGTSDADFERGFTALKERYKLGRENTQERAKDDFAKAQEQASTAEDDNSWGDDEGESSSAKGERPRLMPTPFVWKDPTTIPPREFIYGRHLIRKYVSATIAPGGRGKSSLMMAEALDMASGGKVFGVARERLRVWTWNGEDPLEEQERKALAVMLHYGLTPADVEGYLFMNSGRDTEIIIATETRDGAQINVPCVSDMIRAITELKIDVVQIDPFISSHRVSENDNNKIDVVVKTFGRIADATGCAIDLSHHVRKGGPGSGGEIGAEDARGAGALLAGARSVRLLNPAQDKDAGILGDKGKPFEPHFFFRIDNGKSNLAPPGKVASWFKLESVSLGNVGKLGMGKGDAVGVVVSVQSRAVMEDVTERHLAAVQSRLMDLKDVGAAEDLRSPEWIGRIVADVLEWDLTQPGVRSRIDAIVKVWVASKALVVFEIIVKKNKRVQRRIRCGELG